LSLPQETNVTFLSNRQVGLLRPESLSPELQHIASPASNDARGFHKRGLRNRVMTV